MQKTTKAKLVALKSLNAQKIFSYWALLGAFFLLCGLAVFSSGSIYHKFFYVFVIPPAIFFISKNISRILKNPIISIYLLFILSVSFSTLINNPEELSASIKRSIYILSALVSACLLMSTSKEYLKNISIAAAISTLIINIYLSIPFLNEAISTKNTGLRFIGGLSLDNPLLSSHVFGFFTVLVSICAINSKSKKQAIYLSITALFFLILTLATGSRTPLLALTCTAIWMVLISKGKTLKILSIALIISMIVICLIFPDIILSRGLSYRPELWSLAIKQIMQAPLLGYGFDAHPSLYIESLNMHFREPHNIHISVAYYSGLIGASLWMAMHIIVLIYCIKNRDNIYFIAASCLLIYGISAGMTEGGSLLPRPKEHWFITWIPLALATGLIYQKMNNKALTIK